MIVGLLAERQFGRVRLFVNGENLTGVRQTRWDPLLRPTRAADGRWTVDAWAPLEGRNINGGHSRAILRRDAPELCKVAGAARSPAQPSS